MTTAAGGPASSPPAVSAEAFKAGMRRLAGGVTVLTTSAGDRLNGMTATAVCSVSVSPPRLLAVVNREAASHGLMERSGAFAVNVLAAHQDDLATRFAMTLEHPFEGLAFDIGETGCPRLSEAAAVLECRVVERCGAGSHTIFIGEVVSVCVAAGEPLLYVAGAFRRLAPIASEEGGLATPSPSV